MTQTSDQSPIPLRQILIFSVFNLINVAHVCDTIQSLRFRDDLINWKLFFALI